MNVTETKEYKYFEARAIAAMKMGKAPATIAQKVGIVRMITEKKMSPQDVLKETDLLSKQVARRILKQNEWTIRGGRYQ